MGALDRQAPYVRPHTRRTPARTTRTRGATRVRVHYRSNGSYVRSHMRRAPGGSSTSNGAGGTSLLAIC
jgi:hypothetical protein